jgi:hypothetical protein
VTEPLDLPWEWKYADEAGVGVPGPEVRFDSQEAAEAWLTEHFAELADAGITAVNLFDGEHVVYGPMPLAPAD